MVGIEGMEDFVDANNGTSLGEGRMEEDTMDVKMSAASPSSASASLSLANESINCINVNSNGGNVPSSNNNSYSFAHSSNDDNTGSVDFHPLLDSAISPFAPNVSPVAFWLDSDILQTQKQLYPSNDRETGTGEAASQSTAEASRSSVAADQEQASRSSASSTPGLRLPLRSSRTTQAPLFGTSLAQSRWSQSATNFFPFPEDFMRMVMEPSSTTNHETNSGSNSNSNSNNNNYNNSSSNNNNDDVFDSSSGGGLYFGLSGSSPVRRTLSLLSNRPNRIGGGDNSNGNNNNTESIRTARPLIFSSAAASSSREQDTATAATNTDSDRLSDMILELYRRPFGETLASESDSSRRRVFGLPFAAASSGRSERSSTAGGNNNNDDIEDDDDDLDRYTRSSLVNPLRSFRSGPAGRSSRHRSITPEINLDTPPQNLDSSSSSSLPENSNMNVDVAITRNPTSNLHKSQSLLYWSGQLPHRFIEIDGDQLTVKYVGAGQNSNDVGSIKSNKPLSGTKIAAYFEIKVIDIGQRGSIGVGISTSEGCINKQPGSDAFSYGILGDDGKKYHEGGRGIDYGPMFSADDIIGCGINYLKREVFFTINGKCYGTAFSNIKTQTYYAAVGLHTPGEVIRANFGQEEFLFDIDGYIREEQDQLHGTMLTSDFPMDNVNTIILDYLAHHGYMETFNSFTQYFEAGDSIEPHMLNSLAQRNEIQSLIRQGMITQAMEHVQKYFPKVLLRNSSFAENVKFLCKVQEFIEMIQQKSPPNVAIEYLQKVLNPYAMLPFINQKLLNDASALLIYEDPLHSPITYLLQPSQREMVADALNSLIISDGSPEEEEISHSKLEILIQQLVVAQYAFREEYYPTNAGIVQPSLHKMLDPNMPITSLLC